MRPHTGGPKLFTQKMHLHASHDVRLHAEGPKLFTQKMLPMICAPPRRRAEALHAEDASFDVRLHAGGPKLFTQKMLPYKCAPPRRRAEALHAEDASYDVPPRRRAEALHAEDASFDVRLHAGGQKLFTQKMLPLMCASTQEGRSSSRRRCFL